MKVRSVDISTNKNGQEVQTVLYQLEGGADGRVTTQRHQVIIDKPLTKAQIAAGVLQMAHISIKTETMLLENDSVAGTVRDVCLITSIHAYDIPVRPEITLDTSYWAFLDGGYTMFWGSVSSGTRSTTVLAAFRALNGNVSW
jgi:hypothetical protein